MPPRRHGRPPAARDDAHRSVEDLQGDDVLEGLRACQELLNLVTVHEERLVRTARERGLSWHAIAFYMGVSYQSVHRKWRRRIHGDAYDPNSSRRRDRWVRRYGRA